MWENGIGNVYIYITDAYIADALIESDLQYKIYIFIIAYVRSLHYQSLHQLNQRVTIQKVKTICQFG